mgnify:CR=1 FL=1
MFERLSTNFHLSILLRRMCGDYERGLRVWGDVHVGIGAIGAVLCRHNSDHNHPCPCPDVPTRFEPYLTACLWLGGEVVAAAALRLNLPPPPSSASSSAAASTSSTTGAGAEGTHLQVGSAANQAAVAWCGRLR